MMLRADPPGADRLSVRLRHGTRAAYDTAPGSECLDAPAAGQMPWEAHYGPAGPKDQRRGGTA